LRIMALCFLYVDYRWEIKCREQVSTLFVFSNDSLLVKGFGKGRRDDYLFWNLQQDAISSNKGVSPTALLIQDSQLAAIAEY
ncbi:hypothetical protein ACQP3D_29965, partial [Escherichia coli]